MPVFKSVVTTSLDLKLPIIFFLMEATKDQSDGFHPAGDLLHCGTSAAYSLPKKHIEGMHGNSQIESLHTNAPPDLYSIISRSKNDYQVKISEQKVLQSDPLKIDDALLNTTVTVSYLSRSHMPASQEPLGEQQLTSLFVAPSCVQSHQMSIQTPCEMLTCEQSVSAEKETVGSKCDTAKNDYCKEVECAAQYLSLLHSTGTVLANSALQSKSSTWPVPQSRGGGGVPYDGHKSLENSFHNTVQIRDSCPDTHRTMEDQAVKESDLGNVKVNDVDPNSSRLEFFSSAYKHLLDAKDEAQNLNGTSVFSDETPLNENVIERKWYNVDDLHRHHGWHSSTAEELETHTDQVETLKSLNSPSKNLSINGGSNIYVDNISPPNTSLINSLNSITMHANQSVVNRQHLEQADDCTAADCEQVPEKNEGQNVSKEPMQYSSSTSNLTFFNNVVIFDHLVQKHIKADTLLSSSDPVLKIAVNSDALNYNAEHFSKGTSESEKSISEIQNNTVLVPVSDQECLRRPCTADRSSEEPGSLEVGEELEEKLENQCLKRHCATDRSSEEPGSLETGEELEGKLESQSLQRHCATDRRSEEPGSLETGEELEEKLENHCLQRHCTIDRSSEESGSLETGEELEEKLQNQCLQRHCATDRSSKEQGYLETGELEEKLENQCLHRHCATDRSSEKPNNLETGEELEEKLENQCLQRHCATDRSSEEPGNIETGEELEEKLENQCLQRHYTTDGSSEESGSLETVEELEEQEENRCLQRHCTTDSSSEEPDNLETSEKLAEKLENQCLQRHHTTDRSSEEPDNLETSEELEEKLESQRLQRHCTTDRSSEEPGSLETGEELEEKLENQCLQRHRTTDRSSEEPDNLETSEELEEKLESQRLQRHHTTDRSSEEPGNLETGEELEQEEEDLDMDLDMSSGASSLTAVPPESTALHVGSVVLDIESRDHIAGVVDTKEHHSSEKAADIKNEIPETQNGEREENSLPSKIKQEKKDTHQRTVERKILPARSTRGMRLEEIVQNITPSRSKASGSFSGSRVQFLRSKGQPRSQRSKHAAEEKMNAEIFSKNNDKVIKSSRKEKSFESKKSTVKEPAGNVQTDVATSNQSTRSTLNSFAVLSCHSKSPKTEPQTVKNLEEQVTANTLQRVDKSQLNNKETRSPHKQTVCKDLCAKRSRPCRRISGDRGKKHNVKRAKRKREQQSSLFSPNEPEIRLKYANFKDERRDNRTDSFSPYIKVELKDHAICTVVNYPEEETNLKKNKIGGLVSQNYSTGIVPSSSCLLIGRINNEARSRGELICCLCGRSANTGSMGDLFGPFYPEGFKRESPCINAANGLKVDNDSDDDSSWSTREKSSNLTLGGPRTRSSRHSQSSKKDKTLSGHRGRPNNSESVIRSPPAKIMKKEPSLEEWYRPPVVPLQSNEYWVHEDCAVWCTGVYIVKGKLYGLAEATRLAQETVCSQCHKNGATLGCYYKGCPYKYHYTCAIEAGCFLNEDNFSVRCPKHKDKVLKGSTLIKGEAR